MTQQTSSFTLFYFSNFSRRAPKYSRQLFDSSLGSILLLLHRRLGLSTSSNPSKPSPPPVMRMTKTPTTTPANAVAGSSNLRNRDSEGADVGAEENGMRGEKEKNAAASKKLIGSSDAASTRINTHPKNEATMAAALDGHGGTNRNGATFVEGNASPTNDATPEVPSSSLTPGAHAILGPNWTSDAAVVASEDGDNNAENVLDDEQACAINTATPEAARSTRRLRGCTRRSLLGCAREDGENNAENVSDDEEVFEGFLAEPFPDEIARKRALEMVRQAITLDESAIRIIVDRPPVNTNTATENIELAANVNAAMESVDTPTNRGSKGGRGETLARCVKCLTAVMSLALLLFLTGMVGRALTRPSPQYSDVSSCAERFRDRYDRATDIVATITPLQVLLNASSPQNKAMEWIICQDTISSQLIDSANAGVLPKQIHGANGEDSGEAQVLRRYALATFFFASSDGEGGWTEDCNFLSESKHECAWHQNKTRPNFPYGDFDPAGFVCMTTPDESITDRWVLLDDTEREIEGMELNFRISNNLVGVIPPELGYITSMTTVRLESQHGLYGEIPSSIGNLVNLRSFVIVFAGPSLGGVLPPSLFTIPALKYITLQYSEGVWRFPSSIEPGEKGLLGMYMTSGGLEGTIPSFISEFTDVTSINLSGNSIEGSIPNCIGGLASLEYFDLRENRLNGTLPQSFEQLSELTAMVLGGNKIQGTLPSWMGNLSKLRLIDLSYNELEGGIPSTFSRLQELEHVSLQHNANLNGSIGAFETLGKLTSLSLYSNKFSSTIPPGLFSFSKGHIYADFGHNNFTGQLPQSFTQHATNITYLATMMNNFDNDILDDEVCEQVPVLFADCSSCSCCKVCCEEDSISGNDALCNFDLDSTKVAGLECGEWWHVCNEAYYDSLPSE